MGVLGVKLILETPWLGFGSLALLFTLTRIPRCPAAPLALAAAIVAGWLSSNSGIASDIVTAPGAPHLVVPRCPAAPITLAMSMLAAWATGKTDIASAVAVTPGLPQLVVPSWPEVWRSFEVAVLPQLSLTLTNAVILTASLARELFPSTGSIASERRLALSSGIANLLLCPFGAMPMCHGAGGLAAQFRFGARTGLAPVIFGAVLLVLSVGFAEHAAGAHPDWRGRLAADLRRDGFGDLAPPVRRQTLLLMGDRRDRSRHGHSQPRPWSGIGLGYRIDPRRGRAALHP